MEPPQAVDEVEQEDQRQHDVDVGDHPPVGRLELEDDEHRHVGDRDDRNRQDEDLVDRPLQVSARAALLWHCCIAHGRRSSRERLAINPRLPNAPARIELAHAV
jgi:hypothetical protein